MSDETAAVTAPDVGAPHKLAPRVNAALERLRLSSDIQDLTGLPKPVAFVDKSVKERVARRLAAVLRTRGARAARSGGFDELLRRVLRLVAVGRRGWARPSGAKPNSEPFPSFAGFVSSSAGEDQVVRLSLLLRLMKRRREAVDLLARRVRSGQPSGQSRFWLSQLLLAAGERKAAAALAPKSDSERNVRVEPDFSSRQQPRLRYGIVMLTMFDTPVFPSSLRSLVNSDYPGRIVVVEDGYEKDEIGRAHV